MRRSLFPRILVPVDLSRPSLSALAAAKFLARRWGASLEIVHVTDLPMGPLGVGPGMPLVTTASSWPWKDFHEWREVRLKRLLADFPAGRRRIRALLGWPPAALADLARGKSADLVVMGTHGYAGLDRALFGSTAEAVIRRARVPVLAVRARTRPFRIARVLAPWNGRPYATEALLLARDLARSMGASLEVLHVAPPHGEERGLPAKLRARLGAVLGRGRWTARLRRGDPRRVILEEAKPGRYDLLVLAAHRRPFSSDLVLGSTAERVLRHSRVSVLAVPSTENRGAPKEPYLF
jgi:nucleotide-binding universal stress UspA family protein